MFTRHKIRQQIDDCKEKMLLSAKITLAFFTAPIIFTLVLLCPLWLIFVAVEFGL
jgi:hypothetical protein